MTCFERIMPRGRFRLRAALSLAAILAGGVATPALAQSQAYRNLDSNGIDLTHGDRVWTFEEGSIGSGRAALSLVRRATSKTAPATWDAITFTRTRYGGNEYIIVETGLFTSERFVNGVNQKANGGTISGSGNYYTYTARDGTTITFEDPTGSFEGDGGLCIDDNDQENCSLLPSTITSPDGSTVQLEFDIISAPSGIGTTINHWRLLNVTNGYGYRIHFTYQGSYTTGIPPANWFYRSGAQFFNDTVSTSTPQASVSYSYPASGEVDVTDMASNTWHFTNTTITRPGEGTPFYSATAGTGTWSVTNNGVTTTYSRSVSGSTATMTVTDAASNVTTVVSNMTTGRPTSVTNALSQTTSMSYDSNGRLTGVTAPEGNAQAITLDSRGNTTQVTLTPKSGSGLSNLVTSATYDSTCTDVTCNLPNTTTDARGNTTDLTYNTTHGSLTAETAPAPGGTGTRPEARYSYTLTNGEYLLTGISACQTGSSCASTADEVVTTIGYDSQRNVTSFTQAAGDSSVSASQTATYTAMGDLASVDGPLSGSSDTIIYRYDAARRLVGIIWPDPDGAGSLVRRAVRRTYDAAGRVTVVEIGTVTGTDNTAWAAFTTLQQSTTTYDANGRVAKVVVTASSTTYQVTQYSYDTLGRTECVALRMNPSTWASLPTSACTLATTGSFGPDRITKYTYDALGRVTKVQTAYGVSGVQADVVTTTYTANGRVETVTDGEGNKTTYVYDGHDRLVRTRFPNTTQGAGTSSTTDYEELTLDANGNVTSRRLRDGTSIGYTYDTLNRRTATNLPGSEPDVTYSYDLLGRMTGASSSIATLTFGYDALGRNTSQGGPLGTVSYVYDAAGRRTRMTWPDSFYVDYDYQLTGEMTAIRENGATSGVGVLATFTYDNLGRRTSLTFGNGVTTTYGYDNASRLSSLAFNLDGATTTNDVTSSFSRSPAGAITSQTRTNDLYAWGGHFNVNRGYATNGLNQHTTSGGVTLTYDARGNLTGAGSDTYGYSSENFLTSATVGGASSSYEYDALGRMFRLTYAPSTSQRYQYDGTNQIGAFNDAGAMQRRYVFGPGVDEPLVEYAGSTTSSRTFLQADERGSIVVRSNSSGATTAINSYDEYGIPAAGNAGRFQYTGQVWIGQLGMYYYKARIYSPTLGRFLQTDPIAFDGGINIYAYVGNNPVNSTDPSGLLPAGCVAETGSHIPNCDGRDAAKGYVQANFGNFGDQRAAINAIGRYIVGEASLDATREALMRANFGRQDWDFGPAWDLDGDGMLSLYEANEHYRRGHGAPVDIDATKLVVRLEGPAPRVGGSVIGSVYGNGWIVYGRVGLTRTGPDTYAINTELYDFDIKREQGFSGRNIETFFGSIYAGTGIPYETRFHGSPRVIGQGCVITQGGVRC